MIKNILILSVALCFLCSETTIKFSNIWLTFLKEECAKDCIPLTTTGVSLHPHPTVLITASLRNSLIATCCQLPNKAMEPSEEGQITLRGGWMMRRWGLEWWKWQGPLWGLDPRCCSVSQHYLVSLLTHDFETMYLILWDNQTSIQSTLLELITVHFITCSSKTKLNKTTKHFHIKCSNASNHHFDRPFLCHFLWLYE